MTGRRTRLPTLRMGPPVLDIRTAKPPPKTADPFYSSREWRTLLAEIIRERGRRCEECGRTDCQIYGDHIVELKDGGSPLDPSGIRLLCGSCHGLKTARAREARMRS